MARFYYTLKRSLKACKKPLRSLVTGAPNKKSSIKSITSPPKPLRALEDELKLRDDEIRIAKALKKDKMPKSEREKIIKELDKKMRECTK